MKTAIGAQTREITGQQDWRSPAPSPPSPPPSTAKTPAPRPPRVWIADLFAG